MRARDTTITERRPQLLHTLLSGTSLEQSHRFAVAGVSRPLHHLQPSQRRRRLPGKSPSLTSGLLELSTAQRRTRLQLHVPIPLYYWVVRLYDLSTCTSDRAIVRAHPTTTRHSRMYLGTQQASAHSAPLPVPRREWSFACVHNRQLLGHALTCTNKAVHVVHVTHRCANRTARTARSCPRSAGDRPHTRLSASTHCSELIHRDRRSSCRARPELVGHRPYPSRTSLEATRCTGKAWIRVWPARHNDAARTTPPHMAAPAWHCHAALASRAARAPVTTTPAPPATCQRSPPP